MEIEAARNQVSTEVLALSVRNSNSDLQIILQTLKKSEEIQSNLLQSLGVAQNLDISA